MQRREYTINFLKLAQLVNLEHKPKLKRAHTPSFKHLMNTHPGCSGVVDTRRTTILGQWSHLMSGNGAPTSFWASTEPGRPLFMYLPADRRRCRSGRVEEESVPTCGLAGAFRTGARLVITHGENKAAWGGREGVFVI